MLSISHSLTGAFLASKVPFPVIYFPVIMASHYLEDWIPHWDVGTGLSSGKRKKQTAILLELLELGISVVLIYFFFQHGHSEIQYHAWFGAFIALLPDFMEAPRNFLKWEPSFLKGLNNFHALFHHSTPNILFGLTPQIVLISAIWVLR
jgi:hypothetical protein